MNLELVEKIAKAVLYEGYMLYPYRPSSVKNRERFNFGVLTPEAYSVAQGGVEAWSMQTECLVLGTSTTVLEVKVRFLQLQSRQIGQGTESDFHLVEALQVGPRTFHSWREAVEREVATSLNFSKLPDPLRLPFSFPERQETELLGDPTGTVAGVIVRKQQLVTGSIEVIVEPTGDSLYKIGVRVLNQTPFDEEDRKTRNEALMSAMVSVHTILSVRHGEFVSLLDPSQELEGAAESCRNLGTWPVLVGEEGERDLMLSSPIILYDYPAIAPESAGDLFDGTEIDEILMLRIMTLTDEEKHQMRDVDERARLILERTETLPMEQMMKLHGSVRRARALEEAES